MVEVPADGFYLGERLDGDEHTGDPIAFEPDHLTTHGVIVGMTGSGKTGLGIDLLEEALLAGIPALILDPKGDMGNLELVFPDLAPADFEPWISPDAAADAGSSTAELAVSTAETWRAGLAEWGIGRERMQRLRDSAEVRIFTPGSSAGTPIDVIGSLTVPDDMDDLETVRDEIEGFVTSLTLVDVDADPLSSREHILLSNIVEHAWTGGRDLDLAGLVAQVVDPPMRKLGVFELDAFFPRTDRTALAMRLNGLIAAPAFATWTDGPALDVDVLLRAGDGRPRADFSADEEYECVLHPIGEQVDPRDAVVVDYDERDLRTEVPEGVRFALTGARIDTKRFFAQYASALRSHLHRERTVEVLHNPELGLWARPGEAEDDFVRRCETAADADAAKLRDRFEARIDRTTQAIARAEDRLRELEATAADCSRDELVSGAGRLLSTFLGGRSGDRRLAGVLGGITRGHSRSNQASQRVETAENRLSDEVDDLTRLEEDLAARLVEIDEAWSSRAGAIDTVEIGLEKDDIAVDDVVLAWLPVGGA